MATAEQQLANLYNNEVQTNKGKFSVDSNIAKKDKFQIKSKSYPASVTQQELTQYIVFQINVRGKSSLQAGENKVAVVNRDPSGSSLTQQQLSRATTVEVGVAGAVGGYAAGSAVPTGKTPQTGVQKSIQGAKQTAAKVGGAVAGGLLGAAAVNLEKNLKPDTTYRIDSAITLNIQEPPSVKYSAQYDNKELGTLAGLIGGTSATDSISGLLTEGGGALLTQFAKVPTKLGMGAPADLIGASAKVGLNPFKEVLFQSIDFRSFQFKYRFMPTSVQEANNIKDIIQTFKFHMHPDLSDNKLFFIYPSEFEIMYVNQGVPHPFYHKFKPCVLESLDVTYGGDQYSTFHDGVPTEVNLSMVFRETEILTKREIAKGY